MGPKKKPNQKNRSANAKAKQNGTVGPEGDADKRKTKPNEPEGPLEEDPEVLELIRQLNAAMKESERHRSVTGVLASHAESRDVHLNQLSLTFHGVPLLEDATLELNYGSRFGLIGQNGCGKSTLLAALGAREMPIPEHVDIYLLQHEHPPSTRTALACVIEVDEERKNLEHECELLALKEDEESQNRLIDLYERLDLLEADKAEARAADLLAGLGFTPTMMKMKAKEFSGGWRMRISLARALYLRPRLLLMDEPTNHLDLDATVWLEEELKVYKGVLVIISHSQDFMNNVCNTIMHMHKHKLKVYSGNYDQYVQTREELETNQMKQYKWEQNEMSRMKDYIARFGHGTAKLARQAQSKEKTLKKMVDGGLTEKVTAERGISFSFPDPGPIAPPVIMVQNISFHYPKTDKTIYRNVELAIDLDTRVALVGPNGAGKTTLLKLIAGELNPTSGTIRRHSHVRVGRYHQHLTDHLNLEMTAIDWMMAEFPEELKELDPTRRVLGRYGLTGMQQTCRMRNLSDGQRCRVMFGWLSQKKPHILLLDEPTNHLDMETIDALAEALNEFSGGLILVSHDFRLIGQVVKHIWMCDNENVAAYEDGDIYQYKRLLAKRLQRLKKEKEAAAGR